MTVLLSLEPEHIRPGAKPTLDPSAWHHGSPPPLLPSVAGTLTRGRTAGNGALFEHADPERGKKRD